MKESDTEYRIKHQQKVADDVLNLLEIIDPACIVAGGAPRDWYMGDVAKDIDVFLHLRNDLKASTRRKQIKRALGLEELDYGKSGESIPDHYALNPHLKKCVGLRDRRGEGADHVNERAYLQVCSAYVSF